MSQPPSPDLNWYSSLSSQRASSARCPYATVKACPRYYQSLSLLGEAGSTKIPDAEDKKLIKFWKSSDLWPLTAEQETSINGPSGSPSSYSNFCPEATYERFGYFVSYLSRYIDEIDSGLAQERLAREGFPPGHPNWLWESYSSQHFTDCPIFSVQAHRSSSPPTQGREPW